MQLALLLAASVVAPPQDASFFPFVIPWDDAVRGTATDVSFLNEKPAGKNGRIVVRNGVFVEAKTNRRIKFLGTNFTARGAFPSHADADKVSARLAKLGINVVRFHHLQNTWDKQGMIWKKDKEMLELDSVQLDKLDYLIGALKKQGIYSNVNLQTTRTYLPEMGFPASVIELGTAKRVDKYNRRMIELQKEYAKQLLGRKNKYTGLTLAQDPAVAVVEINNENSLVGAPWETVGAELTGVPEPFKEDLRVLWNRWLAKKYRSNESLESAWSQTKTMQGPTVIGEDRTWVFEDQSGNALKGEGAVSRYGGTFTADIKQNSGPDWGLQANLPGLTINNGDTYTVKFRGRATRPRQVLMHAGLDKADWHNVGLTWRVDLTPEWKDYKTTFSVSGAEPAHTRLGFFLGGPPSEIEIVGLVLAPGADPFKLAPGQSVASANLPLPSGAGEAQAADFLDFLTETEVAYAREMRSYLRDQLGVKGLLIDTQISWGGLTGLVREAPMELTDNHAYYHHPEFPGTGWDEANWIVRNSPMVADMGPGKFGELGGLAQYRVAGKPYTISEYNHPAPSDFQVEMMPLISSFGAVQDWDMVYTFDYGSYGKGEPNDRIQGFFPVSSNPAKAAFFPASAMIFRDGSMPKAGSVTLLELPAKPYVAQKTAYAAWATAGGIPDLFKDRIGLITGNVSKPTKLAGRQTREFRALPELAVKALKAGNVYTADAPSAKVASGYVGGSRIAMKDASFAFERFGNNFAAATLTTCDRKPVAQSKRLLLTVVGRIENRNMGWNNDRTSVGKAWGTGPTMAEFVPATVSIKTTARSVWALDGNGRRKSKVKATYANGRLTFSTNRKAETVWYEVS